MARMPISDGSKDYEAIYLGIGYVASKWEHLMTRVFSFHSQLSTGDMHTNLPTYSALGNSRSQIAATENLAKHFLEKSKQNANLDDIKAFRKDIGIQEFQEHCIQLQKESKSMFARIGRFATKRNQVVHGQIANTKATEYLQNGTPIVRSGLYVQSSLFSSIHLEILSEKEYYYNGKELIEIGNNIHQCRMDFNELGDNVLRVIRHLPSVSSIPW